MSKKRKQPAPKRKSPKKAGKTATRPGKKAPTARKAAPSPPKDPPKTPQSAALTCCVPVEEILNPDFFKSLCDAARVAIVCRLARSETPQNVSEIAACCPTDISVVSRHLAMLRQAGVLDAEKSGKTVSYSVRYSDLAQTLRKMADAIEACCPDDSPCGQEKKDD